MTLGVLQIANQQPHASFTRVECFLVPDGRRKALTDKARGNGMTKVPARKRRGERPVLRPTQEAQRQEQKTATPRRQDGHDQETGWIETFAGMHNLSKKPKNPLPG